MTERNAHTNGSDEVLRTHTHNRSYEIITREEEFFDH